MELLIRIYALLLLVAYRVVSPDNEEDMETLRWHRDYIEKLAGMVSE